MSERGVFAVDRGIFTDPDFADEPFTEREAWLWLVAEAAWKPREKRVGAKVYRLERGQLVFSVRFAATAWKWSKSSAHRFIKKLGEQSKIKFSSVGTDVGQITICKYNAYQRVSLPSGTEMGQTWDKLEDNKNIEDNKDTPSGATVVAFPSKVSEKDVYAFGKKVLGGKAGGVITNLRKACEYDDALAFEYVRQASEKHDGMAWLQKVLQASSAEGRAMLGCINAPPMETPIPRPSDRKYADWRDDPIYRGAI